MDKYMHPQLRGQFERMVMSRTKLHLIFTR